MSGNECLGIKKTETFIAVGIPTGCTGCERAQSTAKTSRAILRKLTQFDDRSAHYGITPGMPQVAITLGRLEELRAQDAGFVALEAEYRMTVQQHSDDSSICYSRGGAVQIYEHGQSSVRCALEINEG